MKNQRGLSPNWNRHVACKHEKNKQKYLEVFTKGKHHDVLTNLLHEKFLTRGYVKILENCTSEIKESYSDWKLILICVRQRIIVEVS